MGTDGPGSNGDVTALLRDFAAGKEGAWDALIEAVHGELHRMSSRQLQKEWPAHTLQTTALLNEAYIRLVRGKQDFENRAHFFGAAAHAMYEVLVDEARRRNAQKRGDGAQDARLDDTGAVEPSITVSQDLEVTREELEAALDEMRKLEVFRSACSIISLRFLTGLSIAETAEVLKVSVSTVKREWHLGRAWLYKRLGGE